MNLLIACMILLCFDFVLGLETQCEKIRSVKHGLFFMPSGRVILIKPTLILSHSRFTMRLWMICWDIYYVIHKYDTVESVIQIDVDDERNRDDNDNDVKTTDMVAQMTTVTPTCDLDYYVTVFGFLAFTRRSSGTSLEIT